MNRKKKPKQYLAELIYGADELKGDRLTGSDWHALGRAIKAAGDKVTLPKGHVLRAFITGEDGRRWMCVRNAGRKWGYWLRVR